MTISLPGVRLGAQRPRVASFPEFVSSAGAEAVELASSFGLMLDDWQQWVLERALGERADGRWSAFRVGLLVPRQNGKGSILEARELAGLLLFGEQRLTHSAHEAKTSKDHFERMEALLRAGGYDESKVMFKRSNQEVSIQVRATGAKLQFYTRTSDGGRGLGGDFVALDEAYALKDEQMAALMPTMAARSVSGNPQMWYTSSAGFPSSHVLQRVREQGEQSDARLAYFDWSADPAADLTDREAWATANPGLGVRIGEEFVEAELGDMSEETFARERLGIWHDPKTVSPIPLEKWGRWADPKSKIAGDLVMAVSTSIDRSQTAIAVCGANAQGVPHVEVAAVGSGVAWAGEWLVERNEKWSPVAIVVDPGSPEGAIIPALQAAGIEPWLLSTRDVGQACGLLFDLVTGDYSDEQLPPLAHTNEPRVTIALEGAKKRPIGSNGPWAWGRKSPEVDVSPLVAVTNAVFAWQARSRRESTKRPRTGGWW